MMGCEISAYRYGFNGMEKDDNIKGEGNSVNYNYRMHDPRIGRFFAVDPLDFKFPHNSPYAFSENRVIDGVEYEGLEVVLIGKEVSGAVGASGSSGARVIFGPDGIEVYGSLSIGLESDVSISNSVILVVFPTMSSINDALGWGYDFHASAPKWGGVVEAGVVYSESGDWGVYGKYGWGLGLSPLGAVGVSATKTATRDMKSIEDKLLAKSLVGSAKKFLLTDSSFAPLI
jgi:RHS repeat-associated protein